MRWLDSITYSTAHEFEEILGDSEGQGSLVCCSLWGHKSQTPLSDWRSMKEGRLRGKKSACVLHLSGLVFKWKPKKQKYSGVKTELEFPFPIHTINEIIRQRWLPARHFEMRALRHNLWLRTQDTENLSYSGLWRMSLSVFVSLSVSLSHTHRVDLRFYQKSHNLWLSF